MNNLKLNEDGTITTPDGEEVRFKLSTRRLQGALKTELNFSVVAKVNGKEYTQPHRIDIDVAGAIERGVVTKEQYDASIAFERACYMDSVEQFLFPVVVSEEEPVNVTWDSEDIE